MVRAEGRGRDGAEGWRLRFTRKADALVMMCPTLFGETMVLEQGGKVGEIGEGDREKARTRADKVIFIELNLFIQTWLSRLPN